MTSRDERDALGVRTRIGSGELAALLGVPRLEDDWPSLRAAGHVESPADVVAIEMSGSYRGRYFVLMGHLSPLDGIGPEQLGVRELEAILNEGTVREFILATNPNVEGEATALYIARRLKPTGVRVTRIAFGLPVGGDIEYADEVTMARSLENRREL